jgi:cation diffusion facilitator family transporter
MSRQSGGKARAAWVSVGSNTLLVAAKLAAGAITGSIAIVTEAAHSAIDLVASIIALVSVRMADEPPDPEHPYGHERFENFAAVVEGMLIVVGAGIIVYEATRKLVHGTSIDHLGVGIAVIAASALVNACVATFLARRSRELGSAALEGDAAHLGTDSLTSVGVLVGLLLVHITGRGAFDPIAALCVAAVIVFAGLRILTRSGRALVDEAPPAEQLDQIESIIAREREACQQIVGYHKLRARRSGLRILVDFHLQFVAGTTLENAHHVAHRLRDAIEAELQGSEVLIHVEPEGSYRQDPTSPLRSG